MQRQADAYFLNASNGAGPLRPAGGGTFGGSIAVRQRPDGQPGQRLDPRGADLRRRRRCGSTSTARQVASRRRERRHPDHRQPALDRRQHALRRVLPRAHRRGPRLQPRAHPNRHPDRHEHPDRASRAGHDAAVRADRAGGDRGGGHPDQPELDRPRPTTSASPATASSAARARAAPTSPQIATPDRDDASTTPGSPPSTTYSYRVRATDAAGNLSAYSTIATATTRGRGRHDAADRARPGWRRPRSARTQIDLAWAASTDNVGVTGYRVERCQGAGCTNFAQVATPTGDDASTTPACGRRRVYRYRVRAADAAGNLSAYSTIVDRDHRGGADTHAADRARRA